MATNLRKWIRIEFVDNFPFSPRSISSSLFTHVTQHNHFINAHKSWGSRRKSYENALFIAVRSPPTHRIITFDSVSWKIQCGWTTTKGRKGRCVWLTTWQPWLGYKFRVQSRHPDCEYGDDGWGSVLVSNFIIPPFTLIIQSICTPENVSVGAILWFWSFYWEIDFTTTAEFYSKSANSIVIPREFATDYGHIIDMRRRDSHNWHPRWDLWTYEGN